MTKWQLDRDGGPWDYPTLGFSAVDGAIIDGSLSNPVMTDPPDGYWTEYVGGSAETGVTRWGELVHPPAPAEPTEGSVYVYRADDNRGEWANGEDVFAEGTSLGDALSATIGSRVVGLTPPTAQQVSHVATDAGPRFIDSWGGYLWGTYGSSGDIFRSVDGETWTLVSSTWPGGWIGRLIPTADGEVLAMSDTEIRKSSGWAANPATATWSANKVTPNGSCVFNGFGLDGDGTKFVLVEYNNTPADWDQSRYGHVSLDEGDTWTTVYDSQTLHGAPASDESHLHSACYDPWEDRFWIGEGHGSAGGMYYSDNNGASWSGPLNIEDSGDIATNAPTVAVATDSGIVLGSDNGLNGLFGIPRTANPADMAIVRTWALHSGRDGLVTFAQRGWRDPDTGIVYVGFRAEYDDTPVSLAAGTALSGGLVYEDPTLPVVGGSDAYYTSTILPDGRLLWSGLIGGEFRHYTASLTAPGSSRQPLTEGNLDGGTTTAASGLAAGRSTAGINATVTGHGAQGNSADSTVYGHGAASTGNAGTAVGKSAWANGDAATALGRGAEAVGGGTAVGYGAQADLGIDAVAVGVNAKAQASGVSVGGGADGSGYVQAVVVGQGAISSGGASVSVGYIADAGAGGVSIGGSTDSGDAGVAIGQTAKAASGSVAVGYGSRADYGGNGTAVGVNAKAHTDSVALGQGADASGFTNSVALGAGTSPNRAASVNVGAKDIEVTDATKGLILKSPDGTLYRVKVANGGALTVTAV